VRERAQIFLLSSCKSVCRGLYSIILGVNSRIQQNHVESNNMLAASVHDLTGCIQKTVGDPFGGGASRIPQNCVESDNMTAASIHDLTDCIQKTDGDPFSGGASADIYRGNYSQGRRTDVVQQRFIALVDHSRASSGRNQSITVFFFEGRIF
jgi:hypothetical protein